VAEKRNIAKKPWIVPIPGTTWLERVEENIRASALELTPDDLREIESADPCARRSVPRRTGTNDVSRRSERCLMLW
jgi:diketogulonate reductase-like aldo/keto reductase